MRLGILVLALLVHQSQLNNANPTTSQIIEQESGTPAILTDSSLGRAANYGSANYGGKNGNENEADDKDVNENARPGSGSKQKPRLPPLATYITTSTTSVAGGARRPTTVSNTSSSPASSITPMQSAFAYEAAVPTHIDAPVSQQQQEKQATNANGSHGSDHEDESSKKIIGSSVVTSVSVILNGNEPEFTDALGHKVPKPQPSLQVASPIDLLNPDRYEFYTFDENGELVKRLMTMQEIQSIVANGDGEGPSIIHTAPINDRDPEKNVQDIVNSVQSVLNKEVEHSKNSTTDTIPILDTPDVSSHWSMILPAIFGNAGGDIFPQQKPQQIVMTPDSELLDTSPKPPTPSRSTKKPKPSKRKPGQKRKPSTTTSTTEMTPQIVQEELDPMESVYTGMQQYQNIASNMQNFEGFSQMQMQPIYHKIPDSSLNVDSTTRRVFVNNQEIIQMTSDAKVESTTESLKLTEDLAKKPHGPFNKINLPHRNKVANSNNSTRRPQVTHTKQKIKKRPTTTTTTILPTIAPEPTTTSTTTTTTSTTTSTTPSPTIPTTIIPTTIIPTTIIPTTSIPSTTAPKKKKKKPTRQPIQSSTGGVQFTQTKPHLAAEKRKPSPRPHRPRPTHISQQNNKYHVSTTPITTTAQPTILPPVTIPTTTTTTTTVVPPIYHDDFHTHQQSGHHKHRPRPHKPIYATTTTATTTTVTTPPLGISIPIPITTPTVIVSDPTIPTIVTPTLPSLIAQEFPGLGPVYSPIPESFDPTTSTRRPSFAGTSGYPFPTYEVVQPEEFSINQLKKEPLPIMQQQNKYTTIQQSKPADQQGEEDLHTIISFDQIMHTLTDNDDQKIEAASIANETLKKPTIVPVKYDSAETLEELEEMVDKKKRPIVHHMPTVTPSKQNYGGSTLATMLTEEDGGGYTGRPVTEDSSTSTSESTEDSTASSEEGHTPLVVITARPQFHITSNKTETGTQSPFDRQPSAEIESTEMPNYSQDVTSIEEEIGDLAINKKPTDDEQLNVVKTELLYADLRDPVVSELATTTEATPEIITTPQQSSITYGYGGDDGSVEAMTLDRLATDTDTNTSTGTDEDNQTTEINEAYETQSLMRLPVTQKVESLIADDQTATELPTVVVDLKPHLNMEVIKPNEQISMSEFQTQAATVASTLVDGANTLMPGDIGTNEFGEGDMNANANETIKSELEQLMSDVLQQITGVESDEYGSLEGNIDSNRLTNYAQMNSSFLMQPIKEGDKINGQSETIKPEAFNSDSMELPQKSEPVTDAPFSNKEDNYSYELSQKLQHQVEDIQTTTFKIPILSLSQIYTQQQQAEEDLEEMLQYERDSQYSEHKENSQAELETSASSVNYGQQESNNPSTESEVEQNTENDSTEVNYTLHLKDDTTTNVEKQTTYDTETFAEKDIVTNNYEEVMQAADEKSTMNTNADTTTDQTYSTINTVTEAENELSNEQVMTTDEHHEDSVTNAAQLQVQYSVEPASETNTDFKTETPILDIQSTQKYSTLETESVENLTESPSETSVVLTESDIDISSEQVTEKYSAPTTVFENSGSNSEELSAMITEDIETTESTEDDPYVKLGELLSKPIEQTKNEKENNNQSSQMINGHQAMMPNMSYGQQSEQADEEDEDDQQQTAPATTTRTTSSSTVTIAPKISSTTRTTTTTTTSASSTTKRINTLKPVSYYKQPAFSVYNHHDNPVKVTTYSASVPQQRPMQRPASLSNLMAPPSIATRPPVKLDPSPTHSKGLEASVSNLDEDVLQFARLCNELAFTYWNSITSERISSARSLIISPFALTSMLSMVFLGARGGTSGEMNEVLKLDDMVTFNPHLVFKNITDSVEKSSDSDIATVAFVREIFSDRANGKILQFFKEKTQQLYAGHVEEVNFNVVNDIIRRRTNLLVKRHTMGKVLEYLRTNSVWVNGPLATISANLFQTDCRRGSTHDRDGEMFFQVHPSVRQRRIMPIPAVLYKSGFTAGYEPNLDVTVVAFGRIQDTVSTIYVMPGHQSTISPSDNLERLEKELAQRAFSDNAWSNILTSLMDRPGMEVQLPRFSHRSFVNASLGLQKMGLKGLFKSDYADLRGLTGTSNHDIYLSDMIQINTFSTCGEEKIADHHHVEMYPAPPLRKRNKDVESTDSDELDSSEAIIDFGSLVQDSVLGRGFYDDLLDPKYLELPLPLRPRQARVPDAPRLRFDKPFLYFVRHNPTGMILFMGRFNPRLLP